MNNILAKRAELIRDILVMRTKLEDRIRTAGGEIPPPWPWDTDGTLRNLQLLEVVEDLERRQRGKKG